MKKLVALGLAFCMAVLLLLVVLLAIKFIKWAVTKDRS